ncbi:class I adenylate-forming enzyme family protein [Rhabdothermincola sp.]|uniref:class I adenylate-forming enzyme family protein n=1 Tax=Rhabdothermincola sp. TaxID=2820405 RepID=UPI002FE123F3
MAAPVTLGDLLPDPPEPPDRPLVHIGERIWRAAELSATAAALTEQLRAQGIGGGDRVGVSLPNGGELVATLFGVWRAGATYVPLNPRAPVAERERLAEAAGTVATVRLRDGVPAVERIARSRPQPRSAEVALVQFTSGTTGPPKPVPLRHDTVLSLIDGVLAKLGVVPGERRHEAPMPNLVPVSLSLWAGLYTVLFAFRVGAPVVVMEQFEPSLFAELVRRHEIRSTVLPPAALCALADDPTIGDLSPLRFVRSITAPLSPSEARRFTDRFGVTVLNSYGQTELGGEIIGWNAADARAHGTDKLGSIGRPHDGVEVRIDGGELCVRTAAMRAGGVAVDLSDRLTSDGWLRTGDLAHIDDDGFVWIDGRVSDLINRGGFKVFPADVEEVIRSSGAVADVAVVGVPDRRLGEVPVAFVVPRNWPPPPDLAASLVAHCRNELVAYKVPAHVVPVRALPRNEIGKVRRGELISAALAPDVSNPTVIPTEERP